MRKRDNPYTPGSARRPHTLAGRDEELARFGSLLERLGTGIYPSLIYTGLRGVGKSVLLGEFDLAASEAGWATTDVQVVDTRADPRTCCARMTLRLLVTLGSRCAGTEGIERAFAMVGDFARTRSASSELELPGQSGREPGDPGDLGQDLASLLREIGRVALECGTGAILFFDEMQRLDAESLASIGSAFQALSRSGLPVAMVGAGQPDLRAALVSAKPYADRLFHWAELGGLTDIAAKRALTAPAASAGVTYEDAVVERVVREAAGLPYLIQVYGSELWNYANATLITMADLDAALDVVRDALDRGFFGAPMDLGTGAERRYLSAMASLGTGPYAVAAVARAFGVEDQRRVSVHRDSLMHKGLIWSPARGRVDFTVPLFAQFLIQDQPIL